MTIFLSHARADEPVVRELVRGFEIARRPLWFDDDNMTGSDAWWTQTLANIRECTVFVFALSDASQQAKSCRAELEYALALAKPIVPIQVGPIANQMMTPLAALQIVRYHPDQPNSGFEVLAAVDAATLHASPLPETLPNEPALPYAYLREVDRKIDSAQMDQRNQLDAVDQLRKALQEEDDESIRGDIRVMLTKLMAKPWRTSQVGREIELVLQPDPAGTPTEREAPALTERPTASPEPQPVPAAEPDGRELFEQRMAELRRQTRAGEQWWAGGHSLDRTSGGPLPDEDVQFTVYRPRAVQPGNWDDLLVFAHLSAPFVGPDGELVDPERLVREQAGEKLGARASAYGRVVGDSGATLPRGDELMFVPWLESGRFQPPRAFLRWEEPVHRIDFQLQVTAADQGHHLQGGVEVYLGVVLISVVPFNIRVGPTTHALMSQPPDLNTAATYRNIFASYSHRDDTIVRRIKDVIEATGDRYLMDVHDLRAGELWQPQIAKMITEASVFQLFWSANSMRSRFVREEWEYAMSLRRARFVRPVYWQDPLPKDPNLGLPPSELLNLHFGRLHTIEESTARTAQATAGSATYSGHARASDSTLAGQSIATWSGVGSDPGVWWPSSPSPPPPPPPRAPLSSGRSRGRVTVILALVVITLIFVAAIAYNWLG